MRVYTKQVRKEEMVVGPGTLIMHKMTPTGMSNFDVFRTAARARPAKENYEVRVETLQGNKKVTEVLFEVPAGRMADLSPAEFEGRLRANVGRLKGEIQRMVIPTISVSLTVEEPVNDGWRPLPGASSSLQNPGLCTFFEGNLGTYALVIGPGPHRLLPICPMEITFEFGSRIDDRT